VGTALSFGVLDRAPMTFGQLSVWRSMSGHGHSSPAAATMLRVWTYPAETDERRLQEALVALEARHESLRTCYNVETLEQLVRPPRTDGSGRLPDGPTVRRRQLDPETEYPWAYAIDRADASAPWVVTAAIHHIAADGWGTDVMSREIQQYVDGAASPSPAPQPRDLARVQHGRGAEHSDRLIKYWTDTLNGREPFRAARPESQPGSDWAIVTSYDCLRAALLASRAHSVSIHAIALRAFVRLLRYHGQKEPLIALLAGNRYDPRWRGLVSSMNQIVPLAIRLDGDAAAELARIQSASLRAYRYAMFDVDRMEAALGGSGFNGTGRGFANFFNYAELATVTMPTDRGTTREVTTSGRDNGFPVYLRVTASDTMQLTLKQTRGHLTEDTGSLATTLESSILEAMAS
jgi:hypothetical protein